MKSRLVVALLLLCVVGCGRSEQSVDIPAEPPPTPSPDTNVVADDSIPPVDMTGIRPPATNEFRDVGSADDDTPLPLHVAAAQGDPEAQYKLGYLYEHGEEGYPQDYAMAFEWYRKAAVAWHVKAQERLGWFYEHGTAGETDYDEALNWYVHAAQQGDVDSQYRVANMYYEGKGTEVSYAAAAKWYHEAAKQGHAKAQVNLGLQYLDGQGVARDYAEARKWLQMAADQENPYGQNALGTIYAEGLGVERDDEAARRLYLAAAMLGLDLAQLNLGYMCADGSGTQDPNHVEALKWYMAAAEQGNAEAQYNVGVMHGRGMGTPLNYGEAVNWYRQAVDQGYAEAMHNLASLYGKGMGVPRDYDRAIDLFEQAYDSGYPAASFGLASAHLARRNYDEAVKWYEAATELGDYEAPKKLGDMYSRGIGVEVDLAKASESYRLAAERGSLRGLKMLRALADNGSTDAQIEMGKFYCPYLLEDGEVSAADVPAEDTASALYWLTRAKEQGDPVAAAELEKMAASGLTTPEALQVLARRRENVAALRSRLETLGRAEAIARYGQVGATAYLASLCAMHADTEQQETEVLKWCQAAADSDYKTIYNNIAWQCATSMSPDTRNGKLAVKCALKAIELEPDKWHVMDTLAAAYAQDGQFEAAAEWQKAAIDAHDHQDRTYEETVAAMRSRLKMYEDGKAWIDSKPWQDPLVVDSHWPAAP